MVMIMGRNILEKGIKFYKRYGILGGIATLTGKDQIKDKDYEKWYAMYADTPYIPYGMRRIGQQSRN